MPKCKIDGVEHEFKPGETIIQLADRVGVKIPRFCYHPGLSVVAQCRMCVVEVEKMPKLQTSCSTPLTDGMSVSTSSPRVKDMQSSVMEFLLINHPLDCPICDKSGECDLQNYSYDYGAADSRYEDQRRTYMDLDMGPVIKKNMNRCIHCTRCIRFCDEVGGFREMVALSRGNNTEITTVDSKPLATEYAGNLADICPTGSLTLKDFRFKKRVWYLTKTPTICEGCSRGCNIELHHENNVIHRTLPRENQEINKWWICDEGRFNFHYVQNETRVIEPALKAKGTTEWSQALKQAKQSLKGQVLALIGTDLTLEEMNQAIEFVRQQFSQVQIFSFGTEGVSTSKEDVPIDSILRRSSKTGNLRGAESLGLAPLVNLESLQYDSTLIFRGGRAQLPQGLVGPVVAWGVYEQREVIHFEVVLPGLSFVEKEGTLMNFEGRKQSLQKALEPRGQSQSLLTTLSQWGA